MFQPERRLPDPLRARVFEFWPIPSWVRSHKWARVPTDGLPHLERWMAAVAARPGSQRGVEVPPSPGKADLVKEGGQAITTR